LYKAVDRFSRMDPPGERAINCFHAISDVDMGIRRTVLGLQDPPGTGYLLRTGAAHGVEASRMLAFCLKPYVVGRDFRFAGTSNERVARLMGLYDFDIPMAVRSEELYGHYEVAIDRIAILDNGGAADPDAEGF